eukprot:10504665-Heterocapsa_arctica.AAC.1
MSMRCTITMVNGDEVMGDAVVVGTYLDYRISMKFKLVDDKYEFIGRDCSGKTRVQPVWRSGNASHL